MHSTTYRNEGQALRRAPWAVFVLALLLLLVGAGQLGPFRFSRVSAASQSIKTVFVIMMENTSWSNIAGNTTEAPYINSLLANSQASYATQYTTPPGNHPSLPNYLWLESGQCFSYCGTDNAPSRSPNGIASSSSLHALLSGAGISWHEYAEGISDGGCPLTDNYPYAPKHNAFVYYNDVNGTSACASNVKSYADLTGDLTAGTVARYNVITPNLCDDMHDSCAPTNDAILQGDTWLAGTIPTIMASAAYQNGGALFLTWDEGGNGSDGPIGMIVLSPAAKGNGYHNAISYTHSSTLRTMEEIFGVSPLLGGAATANDLSDLFATGTLATPTPTATPTNTPAATRTPTVTSMPTPTSTAAPTPTNTRAATPTNTPIPTPTSTAISGSSYASTILGDHPLVYYRLDETSGSTVTDFSGNGHSGTVVGSVSRGSSGATADGDAAYTWSTVNPATYLTAPGVGSFGGSTPFSLESWIKPGSHSSGLGPPDTTGAAIVTDGNGDLLVWDNSAGGKLDYIDWNTNYVLQSSRSAPVGSWTQVVVSWDGTTLRLYLNGQLDASGTPPATSVSWRNSTMQLGRESSSSYPWLGGLDEWAIYGTALSTARVQAHYLAATVSATPVRTNTPVPTSTNTPVPTPTITRTATPTNTPVPRPSSTPTNTPTPTPIRPPTTTSTATPVATRTQLVINGGFENGQSPWTESSGSGYQIINSYRPHSGIYSAWLCGGLSCNDQIWETVTVPATFSKATLAYWYYSDAQLYRTTCYDYFSSRLEDSSGNIITTPQQSCNVDATNGWVYKSFDVSTALPAYKGQKVAVYFQGTASFVLISDFFVDDVTLTTS